MKTKSPRFSLWRLFANRSMGKSGVVQHYLLLSDGVFTLKKRLTADERRNTQIDEMLGGNVGYRQVWLFFQ